MAVFQNAVTGFNINIPRRGRSYHVQTEDSGINNPHIMTHLFLGGNIIATTKSSYADILDAPDLAERVRALMDEQHKEMIRNLLDGKFDEQASKSVQLHAPKVDMLTPYQAPIQRHSRDESAPSDVEKAPPPPAESQPAVPSEALPQAEPEAAPAEPPTKADPSAPAAPQQSASSLPERPSLTAQEQLRAAVIAYLDAARYAVGPLSPKD